MRIPRPARLAGSLVFAAASITAVAWGATSAGATATSQHISTVTLNMAKAYKPKASFGGTDDYHCTLLNPHVKQNSYVISSQFFPGSAEDHHAILFLVPPALAATADRDNKANGGNGWTCFGEAPLPDTSLAQISNTPWLSAWAPGAGIVRLPKDTGIRLPAGSLVIMQVHYNLLVGDKPVKNKLVLHTVPMSTPLLPLKLDLMPAPPDVPCPTGVTGPLCNRAASLANEGKEFGQSEVGFVNAIEDVCGRNPANPPEGDSTSCIWPVYQRGYIVMAGAHMHLTGVSLTMVLNPGTPQAKTILDVPAFNFHNQKAYNLKTPVAVAPGDKIQVTCTYDPRLAQELPILRKVAPHFILWGDGSSDEMCLGLTWTSATLPKTSYPV